MAPRLCVSPLRWRIGAGWAGPALVLSLAHLLPAPAGARPLEATDVPGPPALSATGDLLYAQGTRLVPLEQVVQRLRQRYSGDKLDARIIERPGAVFYEIKWLTADGRKLVITVDAATGAVTGTEGMP